MYKEIESVGKVFVPGTERVYRIVSDLQNHGDGISFRGTYHSGFDGDHAVHSYVRRIKVYGPYVIEYEPKTIWVASLTMEPEFSNTVLAPDGTEVVLE